MWGYVLEVVEVPKKMPDFEKHVGYMNIHFKTKKEAIQYYDAWNPHLRSIAAHGSSAKNGYSDWDPKTYLRYIIREDFVGLSKTVTPFGGEADAPTVFGNRTTYKSFAKLKKNFP